MSRYDKLNKMLKAEKEFKENQQRLHGKHTSVPDNAVIVEKSTAVRATLGFVKGMGKTIAGVIFILLAAIGVLTLIYPSCRSELLTVLQGMFIEITSMNLRNMKQMQVLISRRLQRQSYR